MCRPGAVQRWGQGHHTQWPSCVTTLATSLSCPRSSSRRSPRPSRRTLAGSSGRTSHCGDIVRRLHPGAAHATITMAPSIPMCRQAPVASARCGLLSCCSDFSLPRPARLMQDLAGVYSVLAVLIQYVVNPPLPIARISAFQLLEQLTPIRPIAGFKDDNGQVYRRKRIIRFSNTTLIQEQLHPSGRVHALYELQTKLAKCFFYFTQPIWIAQLPPSVFPIDKLPKPGPYNT